MSSVLDDYEAGEVIGNGSFGLIRKVRRKADGALLARKELNFERMTERDRKQIVAEVNILKDLKHDHIVRYHDRYVDRENGILYILMEFCGGGDLSGAIKQMRRQNKHIPEDTIWSYFAQILLALHHCHFPNSKASADAPNPGPSRPTQQILHRDLKPENVFLDSDGYVKLGDFGLAKQISYATFTQTYVGTPYYMSPELINEKQYDTKSDIWSLGCLIYELCAQNPPFHEAKTHQELALSIRQGRIPPLPRGYSSALGNAIKSMLNINPAMRPSAQQLLQHERIEFACKLSEAQKVTNGLRIRKAAIMNKEREVAEREAALLQREAGMNGINNEALEAERAAFRAAQIAFASERAVFLEERAALNVERAALGDERLGLNTERANFSAEIGNFAAERVFLESQRATFAQEREAFAREKEAFAEEVQGVRMAFAAQVEEMRAERERLDARKEAAAAVVVEMRAKKPLEEQKESRNTAALPPPTRYMSYDETPSKPTQKLPNIGLGFKNQQTPMAKRLASKSMTNLGSAMRGVVLTDSGTVVPTPIRGGADPTVSPSNPLFDDRTLNAPIPAPQLTDAIPIAPLERSASESDAPRLPRLARRSTVGPAARPISVPSGSGSVNSWASAPAPIYDMADEENLPSPFIKRGKADTVKSKKVPGLLQLATGNAAKAGASSSTRTGAGASLRSGTKASLLRAVKAGESVTRTLTSKR